MNRTESSFTNAVEEIWDYYWKSAIIGIICFILSVCCIVSFVGCYVSCKYCCEREAMARQENAQQPDICMSELGVSTRDFANNDMLLEEQVSTSPQPVEETAFLFNSNIELNNSETSCLSDNDTQETNHLSRKEIPKNHSLVKRVNSTFYQTPQIRVKFRPGC